MENKNKPAFPLSEFHSSEDYDGLAKLEYFAIKAQGAIIGNAAGYCRCVRIGST